MPAKPKTEKKTSSKPKTKAKPKSTTKPKPTTRKARAKPAKRAASKSSSSKAMGYEDLLKRAREQIPPEVFEQPRFKVPRVDSFVMGTRTVIRNFKDITDTLRREDKHLLRFLSHELATAGEISGRQAIFNGRFVERALMELVEKYTQEYVVCPICHRPDTEIRREDRLLMLVCSACGGRTPLKG